MDIRYKIVDVCVFETEKIVNAGSRLATDSFTYQITVGLKQVLDTMHSFHINCEPLESTSTCSEGYIVRIERD